MRKTVKNGLVIIAILMFLFSLTFFVSCKVEKDFTITFKTLSVDGLEVRGVVSNQTESFSFVDEIEIDDDIEFYVCFDKYGISVAVSQTVPLEIGDNTFYVILKNGNKIDRTYTVSIRRKPTYTVNFYLVEGEEYQVLEVEEGALATIPCISPERVGYIFGGWDYDLTNPITGQTNINAIWNARSDTAYMVEYYFQNLDDNLYTKDLTRSEEKVGVTDSTVSITADNVAHYSFDAQKSNISGNVNGDGSLVLRLYYNRNEYNLSLSKSHSNGGTITGEGTYKFQSQVILSATTNQGYEFLGWYDGNNLISDDNQYSFEISGNKNVVAKYHAKTGIKYKIEYYFENIYDVNYNLDTTKTQEEEGTVDTTATAIPETFEHFVLDTANSNVSGNIAGDESLTLKLFYNRNRYSLKLDSPTSGEVTNLGEYKYGVQSFISTATPYKGYECKWYSGSQLLSTSNEFLFDGTRNVEIRFNEVPELSDFTFTSTVDECVVNGLKETAGAQIVVPDCVTAIAEQAFYYNQDIISVVLSGSIKTIGERAFTDCGNLSSLTIEEGVEIIEGWAFARCAKLKDVVIPNSVVSVGAHSFYFCGQVKSVKLGNNVKTIGAEAFCGCSNLKDLTLGNGVENIGYSAFAQCVGLEEVVLPNTLSRVGEQAFRACPLRTITIPVGVNEIGGSAFEARIAYCEIDSKPVNWDSRWLNSTYGTVSVIWNCKENDLAEDGYVYTFNDGLLYRIKDGFASIPQQDLTITEAKIKTSIEYKGNAYTINKIGKRAFSNCTLLTEVIIPNGIVEIEDCGFYYCEGLKKVEIPNSVVRIGTRAFQSCDALEKTNFIGTIDEWAQIEFVDEWASPGKLHLNNQPVSSVNLTVATKVSDYAFRYCNNVTEVIIGDTVSSIGKQAFQFCRGLKKIIIGNNVLTIGDEAFSNCSATQITIGDKVDSIGSTAFAGCAIEKIFIPKSVTYLGTRVFAACNNLKEIEFEDGTGWYKTYSSDKTNGTLDDLTVPTDNVQKLASQTWYKI